MCLAVPGRVLDIEGDEPLTRCGRIGFGGVVRHVCLAYVPEAREGDYVLVHAGFAISVMDEAEAMKTLAYLATLDPEELR